MPERADNAMPASEAPDLNPAPHTSVDTSTDENPANPGMFDPDEAADEFSEFDVDEDFCDDLDDTDQAEETAAPEAPNREHRGAHGKDTAPGAAQFPLPKCLTSLCSLPGVERSDFESIDSKLAVARFVSLSQTDTIPLKHLAPDAIQVLHELGFRGHVRGTVFLSERDEQAGKIAFYTSFKLPAREGADNAEPEPEWAAHMVNLQAEIDELRTQGASGASQNPAKKLREAMKVIRETEAEIEAARQELAERMGVEVEALGGAGADDDPDEEGGTLEAALAYGMAKAEEIVSSPTAKKLGKLALSRLLKWLGGEPGADDETIDIEAEDAA